MLLHSCTASARAAIWQQCWPLWWRSTGWDRMQDAQSALVATADQDLRCKKVIALKQICDDGKAQCSFIKACFVSRRTGAEAAYVMLASTRIEMLHAGVFAGFSTEAFKTACRMHRVPSWPPPTRIFGARRSSC